MKKIVGMHNDMTVAVVASLLVLWSRGTPSCWPRVLRGINFHSDFWAHVLMEKLFGDLNWQKLSEWKTRCTVLAVWFGWSFGVVCECVCSYPLHTAPGWGHIYLERLVNVGMASGILTMQSEFWNVTYDGREERELLMPRDSHLIPVCLMTCCYLEPKLTALLSLSPPTFHFHCSWR